jgi:hypothetical protein
MKARMVIDGIPVDPVLPKGFYSTPNERRPASHRRWWYQPFVKTCLNEAWPSGIRFDVYCLDGGAWDRPTARGWFGTLEEAIHCARGLQEAMKG